MRIPRFYQANPQLAVGESFELDDDAVGHIARALRMRSGQQIVLFNGDGRDYYATLENVAKRSVSAFIDSCSEPTRQSPLSVELGQGISRGERMDYCVQKTTELGLNRLTPLFTERCEVKINAERQTKRQQHWQQVAISACEQSLRSDIPCIEAPDQLQHWLENCQADLKFVLHHHSEAPLSELPKPSSIALLIGPEGGLTEDEVNRAQAQGFIPLTLGPRVMRTETAPVAAMAVFQYLWGDF